jgi:hypothetical protein
MKKQQLIDTLQSQLPGFYSVEQVIKMINEIEEPKAGIVFANEEQVKELVRGIVEEINDRGTDVIDDYDLSMNGREVELDTVYFDLRQMENAVNDVIDNWIESYHKEDDCGC